MTIKKFLNKALASLLGLSLLVPAIQETVAAPAYFDRVAMTSLTKGTGTVILSAQLAGPYQSFLAAGVSNGTSVRYVIVDGSAWEVGLGTYTNGSLSRAPSESSNSGNAINLDGFEVVYLTWAAADFNSFLTTVTSNTQLEAASVLAPLVMKTGYNAVGDMPVIFYQAVHQACSLNGGSGDLGSQFPSTTNGWCWNAMPVARVSPQMFGVFGDNSVVSQTRIQAWINYLQATNSSGYMPDGTYNFNGTNSSNAVTAAITDPVKIEFAANAKINWGLYQDQPAFTIDSDWVWMTTPNLIYQGAIIATTPTAPPDIIPYQVTGATLVGSDFHVTSTENNTQTTTTTPFSTSNTAQVIELINPANAAQTFLTTMTYAGANDVTLAATPSWSIASTMVIGIGTIGVNAIGEGCAIVQHSGSHMRLKDLTFSGPTPCGVGINGDIRSLALSDDDDITFHSDGQQFGILARQISNPHFHDFSCKNGVEPYAGLGANTRKPGHCVYIVDRTAQPSLNILINSFMDSNGFSDASIKVRNGVGVNIFDGVGQNVNRFIDVGLSTNVSVFGNHVTGAYQLVNFDALRLVGVDQEAHIIEFDDDTNVSTGNNIVEASNLTAPGPNNQFGFTGNINPYYYGTDGLNSYALFQPQNNGLLRHNVVSTNDQVIMSPWLTSVTAGNVSITSGLCGDGETGLCVLADAAAAFTSGNNPVYSFVTIPNAGTAGASYTGYISSGVDATHAILATPAVANPNQSEIITYGVGQQPFEEQSYTDFVWNSPSFTNNGLVNTNYPFLFQSGCTTNCTLNNPIGNFPNGGNGNLFFLAQIGASVAGPVKINVNPQLWWTYQDSPTRSVSDLSGFATVSKVLGADNAGNIIHTINPGVSAAGSTQGTATSIFYDKTIISSCSTGQGVIATLQTLGAPSGSRQFEVDNETATPCALYGPTGVNINGLAANTAVLIPAYHDVLLTAPSATATQWYLHYVGSPTATVLDYSVFPGAADVTTVLQNAVSNAGVANYSLTMPQGTYQVTGEIPVNSAIKIQGDGFGTVLRQNTLGLAGFHLNSDHAIVDNLRVQSTQTRTDISNNSIYEGESAIWRATGVYVDGVNNTLISHLWCDNTIACVTWRGGLQLLNIVGTTTNSSVVLQGSSSTGDCKTFNTWWTTYQAGTISQPDIILTGLSGSRVIYAMTGRVAITAFNSSTCVASYASQAYTTTPVAYVVTGAESVGNVAENIFSDLPDFALIATNNDYASVQHWKLTDVISTQCSGGSCPNNGLYWVGAGAATGTEISHHLILNDWSQRSNNGSNALDVNMHPGACVKLRAGVTDAEVSNIDCPNSRVGLELDAAVRGTFTNINCPNLGAMISGSASGATCVWVASGTGVYVNGVHATLNPAYTGSSGTSSPVGVLEYTGDGPQTGAPALITAQSNHYENIDFDCEPSAGPSIAAYGFATGAVGPPTSGILGFSKNAVVHHVVMRTNANCSGITSRLFAAVNTIEDDLVVLPATDGTGGTVQEAVNFGAAQSANTGAALTGVLASGVLTASAVTGTIIPGEILTGVGVTPVSVLPYGTSSTTGTGGSGTYATSGSQTLSSVSMNAGGACGGTGSCATTGSVVSLEKFKLNGNTACLDSSGQSTNGMPSNLCRVDNRILILITVDGATITSPLTPISLAGVYYDIVNTSSASITWSNPSAPFIGWTMCTKDKSGNANTFNEIWGGTLDGTATLPLLYSPYQSSCVQYDGTYGRQ